MKPLVNIVGFKFNKLTVTSFSHIDKRAYWNCICECGNEKIVRGAHLKSGYTKSCGCLMKNINIKHGLYNTPENKCWRGIKERCFNSKNPAFKNYGGRGITMCEKWVNSFEEFLKDMGKRPSSKYSIDRINNNGNYEPSNCKWSTVLEQNNNKRNNKAKKY